MKCMRSVLLLPFCLAILAGCGGGGSGPTTRLARVTIIMRWPGVGRSASRAIPAATNFVTYEVFAGTKRIANFTSVGPVAGGAQTTSTTVSLPVGDLTFYVNAYATTGAADQAAVASYITNPVNGQIDLPGGGPALTSAPQGQRPVAHATSTQSITANGTVTFTLANTIATLTPITTPVDRTTFTLDVGTLDLTTTILAQDSTGGIVLFNASDLSFQVDPSDTLGNLRAGITGTQLTPSATGTVRVIIQDTNVNPSPLNPAVPTQAPIQATVTYTITPHAVQPALTLNVAAGSALLTSLPYYAKSVTFTLTQTPLVAPTTSASVLDSPPATQTQTTAVAYDPVALKVSVPTAPALTLVSSGRSITLAVKAFSNADGTGTVLADGSVLIPVASLPTANASENVTLSNFHVTGFAFTPAAPVITLTNTASTGNGLNTLLMQVSALVPVNGSPTQVPIDPRTVSIISAAPTTVASVSFPTSPLDSNGNPYFLLTGISDNGATGSATTRTVAITASDYEHPAVSSAVTLTVQRSTPGYTFN